MASSQDTSVSSNSFGRWTSHDIFLFKYHFLLHILRFLFFFLDNIMADVASKQQTTALFLSTTVTRTRRHTELTWPQPPLPPKKELTNLMGNLCCAREHSIQFFVQFFYTVKLHSLVSSVCGPLGCMGPLRSKSASALLLRLWVRISPWAWMSVCCEFNALSGTGLCVELITRPEEPNRVWRVVVCDLETSWARTPWPALDHSDTGNNNPVNMRIT